MFTVFVGFYLYTDHAPWPVWALAGAGLLVDEWRAWREKQPRGLL